MNQMSDGERRARLQAAMAQVAWQGDIVPLSDFQFQLIHRAPKVNHVLHLLLTLVTCGLWGIVWFIMVATEKHDTRKIVAVDEAGGVWLDSKLWWPPPTPEITDQPGQT